MYQNTCKEEARAKPNDLLNRADNVTAVPHMYLPLPFTENVIGHPPASQLELVLCQEGWDAVLELAVYQKGPALAGRFGANSS